MTSFRANTSSPRIHAALFLCLAICGCGGSAGKVRPTGMFSGTVTLGNGPLPEAILVLEDPERGIGVSATIEDGQFVFIDPIPIGTYQVTIHPPPAPPPLQADPSGNPADVAIPTKYRNPETSGLTQEIETGPNTVDFQLHES